MATTTTTRCALVLALVLAAAAPSLAAVAESTFAQSGEGWTWVDLMGDTGDADWSTGAISHADTDADIWFFSAPASFLGDRVSLYNGKLIFTLGPVQFNDNGAGPIAKQDDIVITTTCGHSLSKRNVVTAGQTKTYEVLFNEDGWIDSRTGSAPDTFDFLGALENLAGIRIRGGFFTGAETTQLDAVSITAGPQLWHPCCTMTNDVDFCSKPGSPYFNPATLKFYCEGSQKKLITVTKVVPRFARRTGGTTVTVTGLNLGMAGSSPVVRVNGVPCQKTWYSQTAIEAEPSDGNRGPLQETAIMCSTPQGEGGDLGISVEAAPGPTDSPFNQRNNRNARAFDYYETTATSCISEDSRGFAYGGHDFAWAVKLSTATAGPSATQVAVDANTGDVYAAGYILNHASDPELIIDTMHARIQDRTNVQCTTDIGKCSYLIKFDKLGKVQWVVRGETGTNAGAASSMAFTSVAVDPASQSAGAAIYVTGVADTQTAGVSAVFTPTIYSADGTSVTAPAIKVLGANQLIVAKVDGAGVAAWVKGVAVCTDVFGSVAMGCSAVGTTSITNKWMFDATTVPKIGVYHSSISQRMNQQTKGDHPSHEYIEGEPRDNGGVYITAVLKNTVAGGATQFFRFSDTQVPSGADPVVLGNMFDVGQMGVLAKYDSSGAAHWVRAMGTSTHGGGSTTKLTTPVIKDMAVSNDAVFVTGYVVVDNTATDAINFDSCAYTNNRADNMATNQWCGNAAGARSYIEDFTTAGGMVSTAAQGGDMTTGTASLGFVAAYDASGLQRWIKTTLTGTNTQIQDSENFQPTAVAFMRPLVGDTPLWDHTTGPYADSMEGRNQAPETGHASGFYVYVAGRYQVAATKTVMGKALEYRTTSGNWNIFLFKFAATDGTPQWVSQWGNTAQDEEVTAIAADTRTGAVFIAGIAPTPTGRASCVAGVDCGDDLFFTTTQGIEYQTGCMVDYRHTSDLTNAQQGRSRCKFASFADASNAGFIIKVTDKIYDSRGRVVSEVPDNIADPTNALSRPSVIMVKSFGVSTKGTSHADSIAIADSDLVVGGGFAGQDAGTGSGSFTIPNVPLGYGTATEAAANMVVVLSE